MHGLETRPVLLMVFALALFAWLLHGEQTPAPLVAQARELIQQGKLAEAEAKLLEAEKAEPNSLPIQRLLGVVYERQKNYQRAEAALRKVVLISGEKEPETLFLLCKVKFALQKTGEALALAQQICQLAENDPRPLYAVGRLLRENGHATEGIVELERAHRLAPGNAAIATELVAAYLDAHRTSEAQKVFEPLVKTAGYEDLLQVGSRLGEANHLEVAVAAFERAATVRPSAYDGLFDLAFAYFRQGSFTKSLAVLDRMRNPQTSESGDYHYLRGKVEVALHHDQLAAEEFREALQLQPENESLCVDAGLFFSRFQDFWKALEIFQACAQKLPDSVAVETGQGLTYFHLGKYPEAIATFRKVLSLNPQMDAAREALGFLLYISGRLPEARQVLEERTSVPKADFYIYFLHALVLQRLERQGNREAAESSLNEALARSPKFAPAYFQRGKIAFDRGDLSRALADFQTATRLDPAYAQPYYLIAQVYFKQGNRGAAEQAQARFNSLNREREEKEQEQQVESRLVQALQ
jgi:tetratricopeptide (TPR) repeat protein